MASLEGKRGCDAGRATMASPAVKDLNTSSQNGPSGGIDAPSGRVRVGGPQSQTGELPPRSARRGPRIADVLSADASWVIARVRVQREGAALLGLWRAARRLDALVDTWFALEEQARLVGRAAVWAGAARGDVMVAASIPTMEGAEGVLARAREGVMARWSAVVDQLVVFRDKLAELHASNASVAEELKLEGMDALAESKQQLAAVEKVIVTRLDQFLGADRDTQLLLTLDPVLVAAGVLPPQPPSSGAGGGGAAAAASSAVSQDDPAPVLATPDVDVPPPPKRARVESGAARPTTQAVDAGAGAVSGAGQPKEAGPAGDFAWSASQQPLGAAEGGSVDSGGDAGAAAFEVGARASAASSDDDDDKDDESDDRMTQPPAEGSDAGEGEADREGGEGGEIVEVDVD